MAIYPFEVPLYKIFQDPEKYVNAVFSCLESEFLVMPKGDGFVDYPVFESGYEALKIATSGFSQFDTEKVFQVTVSEPISIVVLRSMLGFTPPEWGYVTMQRTGVAVTQGFIRTLDRKVRMNPGTELNTNGVTEERLKAMVKIACQLLTSGAPEVEEDQLHRLDKADTRNGIDGIKNLSRIGAPYATVNLF